MVSLVSPALVARLHRRAQAARWRVSRETFAAWLEASAARAFDGASPTADQVERYCAALHLEDLALACACAEGVDAAWDHFVTCYRPGLYRAADALDPSGGAREAADSLYGELFGLTVRADRRHSHLRYFHGRSSLATWLRAVLAQRFVDGRRSAKRVVPLPDDERAETAGLAAAGAAGAVHSRRPYLELLRRILAAVVAALPARDRLRLRLYYAQGLTLAAIGAMLGEHEATVSRQLARTRGTIRTAVEDALVGEGLAAAEIDECFAVAAGDPGDLDVAELLGPAPADAVSVPRKGTRQDRST